MNRPAERSRAPRRRRHALSAEAIVADAAEHWPLYVAIPLLAALIGYVTKRAAIAMMFRPLEFTGIRPLRGRRGIDRQGRDRQGPGWQGIGWQGVVPAHAERIATIATETLTRDLVDPGEIFARIDPDQLAREIDGPVRRAVDEVAREVMQSYQPHLWAELSADAREALLRVARSEARAAVPRIVRELAANIGEVFDLKHMVISQLTRDKQTLTRVVRRIARPELTFIARSGVYFGFALGLVQLTVWAVTKQPLVMPVAGFVIGWVTDWLALKMIFLPREPARLPGGYRLHGMFQRRRHQVAVDYGEVIAREIVTVPNIVEELLHGPRADQVHALIHAEVRRAIDTRAAAVEPLAPLTVGARRFTAMKELAAARATECIPDTVGHAEEYATGALDLRNTVVERMRGLSAVQFENLLRPAFRQDEWKLILVGALIGGLIGELQVLLLLR